VGDAIEAGAVAVLTDPAGAEAVPTGVALAVVENPRNSLGAIAAEVYGHPARDLLLIGITGTNGKTTTAYLIDAGLRAAGHTTGVIGTVETRIGERRVPSVRTTPESSEVHALLAVMRDEGITACTMEVSSHALVFGRVDGLVFDVAAFTNLSQDHLDFHTDIEDYFAVKAGLFTPQRARRGVVCLPGANGSGHGDYGMRLVANAAIPTVAVVTGSAPNLTEAWAVTDARTSSSGLSHVRLATPKGLELDLDVPIPGEFNIANAALAVAVLANAGVDPHVAAQGVSSCTGVPGRMQRIVAPESQTVSMAGMPLALVDYAHTPDAVQNVLRALPRNGRIIAVLGAGGDRDRHKRPLMGAAVAQGADVVIVTDDNPRSEDPAAVRAAVIEGTWRVPPAERAEVTEVADRLQAIRAAVYAAQGPDDVVVVLGKGHEQGQEIAGTVHPFDDASVLRDELAGFSPGRAAESGDDQ
jgi:UDP-N-acetylmuramoyl-L-alanyl-D-glutamate--2,6-diaminopimelate ligase